MNVNERAVWRVIRYRIGRKYPITAQKIADAAGISKPAAVLAIRSLRTDHLMRIGYASTRPIGYYIIASDEEARESTARLLSLVTASIRLLAIARRTPTSDVISDILNALSPLPQSVDRAFRQDGITDRQAAHLSHLVLVSEIDEEDADQIYRMLASSTTSKDETIPVIDRLRTLIDARTQRREESKARRLDYHGVAHPENEPEKLQKQDLARHRRDWNKALRQRADEARRALFDVGDDSKKQGEWHKNRGDEGDSDEQPHQRRH